MTYLMKPLVLSSAAGLAVFIAALALPGCSDARSAEQFSEPSSAVAAPTFDPLTSANWTIQAEASHIRFSAKQEAAEFTGEFEDFSGVINFDPDAPETGSVVITIPLRSVEAGSKDRNSTLPGKVWFSVKKFPEAVFTSRDISKTDEGYLAKGALSMKGKSIVLDLPFALEIDGNQAVMTSQTIIDRTLWNVGAAPWDTDEWVSRAVSLDIKVTADRLDELSQK